MSEVLTLTEEDILIQDIVNNLDDDFPKMVLADYLEEIGKLDRAKFLRHQCDREKRPSIPINPWDVGSKTIFRCVDITSIVRFTCPRIYTILGVEIFPIDFVGSYIDVKWEGKVIFRNVYTRNFATDPAQYGSEHYPGLYVIEIGFIDKL